MKRTPAQLRATAYHEAGHAVLRMVLGGPRLKAVTIRPALDSHGHTTTHGIGQRAYQRIAAGGISLEYGVRELTVSMAAVAAEARATGRLNWQGAGASLGAVSSDSDLDHQVDILIRLFPGGDGPEMRAFQRWIALRTRSWVERRWSEIEAVAEALLERETLTGAEVNATVYGPVNKSK